MRYGRSEKENNRIETIRYAAQSIDLDPENAYGTSQAKRMSSKISELGAVETLALVPGAALVACRIGAPQVL